MKTQMATLTLAVLGGLGMLASSNAQAGQIGTYGSCWGGQKTSAITTAGHTEKPLADLSPASLSGLAGLILEHCFGGPLSDVVTADVKAANSNGMLLVIDDWNPGSSTSAALPGTPALAWVQAGGSQIDLVPGMPYITGAGGTLTNSSLDGGTSSNHGYTTSPMPAGVQRLLTTADASQTVAVAYKNGSGTVVYSAMPLDAYLPGASLAGNVIAPGVQTYMTNILSNAGLPSVTCASSGYTGTQLQWCVKICESGLSGKALDDWIHRWIRQFRQLPYCAVGGGNPPPPPPPPPGE